MGRSPCCDKDGLKKGPWLPEEDQKLVDYIQQHGSGNWRSLPKKAGLRRCGKSCRLRWTNYLRPDIKRGRFTFEEEEAIIQLHSVLGNKWSTIAAKLPGRTDNEIKNYWNTHIRKRLLRMGIDPMTHTRHFDLLNLPSILNSPLQNSSCQQFNFLNLLGLQSLINPDLLKLAALLSPNPNPNSNLNPNFSLPNLQENDTSPVQNEYHQTQPPFQKNNDVPSCSMMSRDFGDDQVMMQPSRLDDELTFPSFDAVNFRHKAWSMGNEHWNQYALLNQNCDHVQQQSEDQHVVVPNHPAVSDEFLMKVPSLMTPGTISDETSLNSNSEFPNSSVITSSINEDEIDSYCRSLMNFDVPAHLFNVS